MMWSTIQLPVDQGRQMDAADTGVDRSMIEPLMDQGRQMDAAVTYGDRSVMDHPWTRDGASRDGASRWRVAIVTISHLDFKA